jgi:hypothetical protein
MDNRQPAGRPTDPQTSKVLQRPAERTGLPADFVPLRLVLQPSGATMEVAQADVLVGRHSCADVRLPLPDVSRRHCRLVFVGG